MFIIFGNKSFEKDLGEYKVSGTCPNCHNTINLHILKQSTWFTLYWIPIFPLQIKRFKICPVCRAGAQITKEESEQLLEQ